jgi:hypothetical protein
MDKQPTTTKKPEMAIKKQPKDLAQKLQSMPKVADYFANPGEGVKTFINQQPARRHDDPYGDGNPSEKVKKDKTQSSKVDSQFGRDIEVSERTLTPAETAEKERLVKKMKPVEKWQKRYGKRGEEVMYATATKMAKEEIELDEDSHRDHFTFLRHLQKANIPIAARPSKEEAMELVHRHGDANRAAEVYVRRYQTIKNAARKVQKEEVEIKEQVLLELGEPMSPAPATSDNPGGGDQNTGPQAGDGGSSSDSDRDDDESDDADDVNDEVKQAKEHLEGIALSSAKLFEDIPDDADIPHWILEKLALSEKFLKSVEQEIGDISDDKDVHDEDDEDDGEGDNDEEPSPKQKPTAFGGGKAAMAKESVDLSEAKKKKSPQDKFFDRIKKVSGYDAKEVLSRPAPGEKPAAVKEEKWIQKAVKHPGALHKQLGVPEDETIPKGKLAAAAKKGGKLGKRARLAQTLAKLHK